MSPQIPELNESCACFRASHDPLTHYKELGIDENYAEISLLVCQRCGQYWLRYHYEL